MLGLLSYRTFIRRVSSKVIGIDLGTTNSAVAYIRDSSNRKSATIIENTQGQRTTPSVVAYNKDGKAIIGMAAKRQAIMNPENTFFATKRLIGRLFKDTEIQNDLNTVPYKIIENHLNGEAYLETTFGEQKSPSQVGSEILVYLKRAAEEYLSEEVDKAVLTVPAYFNDSQRQATKEAGRIAGLKVLRVVNEPTAAALSFGLDAKNDGVVAVYDLGGGTFDISILDIDSGVFEVRSTSGDTHLGGEDFDTVVVDHIFNVFAEQHSITDISKLKNNREIMQRIREAAEKSKIALSHFKETSIDLPFLYDNKHLNMRLTEEKLDKITLHLINKTISPVKKALRDAEMDPEDVDEIIMVGGMTRMPKIRSVVSELFGKPVNTTVNPDETVALGAAIQGGILSGEIRNVLLLDVTPLTLGIETYGGVFSPLIPRNTTLPVKKTEVFSTGVDGQTGVDIRVYQGERSLVRDNILIGDFKFAGIPPMPKGAPKIHVTFDIDADGIINVSAAEQSSGQAKSITIIPKSGLSDTEIQKMVDDANANKERDDALRQRVELITKSDIMITDTEDSFKRFHDTISKHDSFPDVLAEIQKVRRQIDHFKAHDADESLDLNELKRSTDHVQQLALQLFRDVSSTVNRN
ncbi:Hsp70 family ATPase SSQ1 Ecym_2763 [Eremothecium cymbalariae DBVPG|uniref:non-chaperonin molecular chaperone ATPase n=1 Tax=Eremothecium cymbalariae (strain CBS 270.75 / DBVPG 7215 / KCTC 17166 / NRRL Y-17582) TaxID=931890 RepID=G8JPZ9_ERECY|nr:Hypothetical protein Ecym_2763 [Eremothecium cymbalariae DBVPG\